MMRRSSMKPGKPLARTPFKRTSPMPSTGMLSVQSYQRTAPKRKAGMKSRGPRSTPIRAAARDQDCTLRLASVCNFDPATTVLCHSNFLADGKGMGLKAPDTAAAFGCSACHDVLDGRRPRPAELSLAELDATFYAAVRRTHEILRRLGLLNAATSTATSKLEKS
ncbi:nuclease domain-containing protein [Janthinobacterium sp.]|uniref:nuclease domain-containing protein n=1 Tax=Janthinobacterium sp. TaxID=1871054 RepID=UPI00261A19BB|nr:nuclease domain-containing protein [Janthinobacterium sp.]